MLNALSPLRMLYAAERRRDLPASFEEARSALSRTAWERYSIGCDRGPIAKTGVVWQPISQEWADRLGAILDNSEIVPLDRGDYADGYMATLSALLVNFLNFANEYRAVTPSLLGTLRGFLSEHGTQINRWIGHPWRICSVRQFNLRPAEKQGARHLDGWPLSMRKVFILPRGASVQSGTTWFRLRDGTELLFDHPSPCWMLFENSVVEHALVAGNIPRPTIELDIVPARKTDSEPFFAGINGWYPWFPENSAFWHARAGVLYGSGKCLRLLRKARSR